MNFLGSVVPAWECDERGVPLDWKRCRTCVGTGAGPCLHPDGEDACSGDCGGGNRSCPTCDGHGSLEAAALAAVVTRVWGGEPPLGKVNWNNYRRCEDCGHLMSEGTWEGTAIDPSDLTSLPVSLEECLAYERQGLGVHYSPCDEGCDHGGPGRKWSPKAHDWITNKDVAGWSLPLEASWRPVAVRALNGHAHDLRFENLALLCLRCDVKRRRAAHG